MQFCILLVVAVLPVRQFITVPGDGAIFNCFSPVPGLVNVKWLINGTLFVSGSFPGVQAEFSSHVQVGNLAFTNIPASFNNTRIGCIGTFSSGEVQQSEDVSLLLLQGIITLFNITNK